MNKWQRSGTDSYYAYVKDQRLSDKLISSLIKQGRRSPTGRARLCLHSHPSDAVHIMLIYHDERTVVPIHRHMPFGEFVLVKDGSLNLVFFDEDLNINSNMHIGSSTGLEISCLTPPGVWHTLQFKQPTIFFEITQGPLNEKTTEFAART